MAEGTTPPSQITITPTNFVQNRRPTFSHTFIVNTLPTSRFQLALIWKDITKNNKDIIIKQEKNFLIKKNNEPKTIEALQLFMQQQTITAFKPYKNDLTSTQPTRGSSHHIRTSYSVVATGEDLDVTDEMFKKHLDKKELQIRFCKRIIWRQRNTPTLMMRLIIGDLTTYEKLMNDRAVQACLVSVSAWTLVAISVERYYAICHPLRSLAWQTISHAYKTIAAIWLCSFACMLPTLVLSQLQPTKFGKHKCRETWPSPDYEKAFNLFLDLVLMVSPLLVLAAMYSLIIRTLWKGIKTERALRCSSNASSTVDIYVNLQTNSTTSWRFKNRTNIRQQTNWATLRNWSDESNSPVGSNSSKRLTTGLRRTNAERSLHNKKRVIRMLCVVVMEFFICWSPLYIINTIVLFVGDKVYEVIGYKGVSFFQLLAYSSSCCNPITYCFMNGGFRKSFLKLFSCFKTARYRSKFGGGEGSDCQIDMKYSNNRYSEH